MIGSKAVEDRPNSALLSFRDKFISSRQFAQLYREGMDLVEETAEYLDRAAGSKSKRLARAGKHCLHLRKHQAHDPAHAARVVAPGPPCHRHGRDHGLPKRIRTGIKLTLVAQSSCPPECFDELPETFKRLIDESHRLYGRILRLDPLLSEGYSAIDGAASPISPQIERIKLEFPAA